MIKVVLAGQYPEGTYEAVRKLLPETEFSLAAVDTQEAYDLMTDAQIMILRIFKAPREVMERNKNLKMILRWGAGYDSVDIKAAGENGILVTMLMYGKEASNRKQEIDRQHYTIPNQRPKDKHCGKI